MRLGSVIAVVAGLCAGVGAMLLSAGCANDGEFGLWRQPTSSPSDAPATNANLTDEQKEQLLAAVSEQVRERAFAAGVDFDKWPDHLKKHQAAIDRATSMSQFSSAVNRALREFGISHIDLMSPRAAQMQRAPRFGGIGITVGEGSDNGTIRIGEVREGSPAAKAGLAVGDVITHVDGNVAELGSIRGQVGTSVKLTVKGADGASRDVSVTRVELSQARQPRLLKVSDEAAVLRIDSFTDGYDRTAVVKAMTDAAAYPMLVIDLRSNGGGRVDNFIHLLSTLLPRGTEVGTFVSKGMAERYKRENGGQEPDATLVAQWTDRKVKIQRNPVKVYEGKVAVLINRGSASASEIVAAAMRELRDAPLVGQRTAGAVLMSQYVKLDSGFEMKVPTSDYVTIKGLRIEGAPLQPDVAASSGRGFPSAEVAKDAAVTAAIDALKNRQAESKPKEEPAEAPAAQ